MKATLILRVKLSSITPILFLELVFIGLFCYLFVQGNISIYELLVVVVLLFIPLFWIFGHKVVLDEDGIQYYSTIFHSDKMKFCDVIEIKLDIGLALQKTFNASGFYKLLIIGGQKSKTGNIAINLKLLTYNDILLLRDFIVDHSVQATVDPALVSLPCENNGQIERKGIEEMLRLLPRIFLYIIILGIVAGLARMLTN